LTDKTTGQKTEKKIEEALAILNALGLPRQQLNERSALTLLSLLGLTPTDRWDDATDPLMGITPMMDFFQEHYAKKYAPNTQAGIEGIIFRIEGWPGFCDRIS